MWRIIQNFRFSVAELLVGSTLLSLSCAALINANTLIATVASGCLFLSVLAAVAVLSNWHPDSRAFCLSFLIAAGLHHYICSAKDWHVPFANSYPFPTLPLLDRLWQIVRTEQKLSATQSIDWGNSPQPVLATTTEVQFGGSGGGRAVPFSFYRPELHLFVNVGVTIATFWCGIGTGLVARALARANAQPPLAIRKTMAKAS
jgi:hypothetical protein